MPRKIDPLRPLSPMEVRRLVSGAERDEDGRVSRKPIEVKPRQILELPHPPLGWVRVGSNLKTALMVAKESEYAFVFDIGWMLSSGPLHCRNGGCGRCIQCVWGIEPSTASRWRKRLGIGTFEGEEDQDGD